MALEGTPPRDAAQLAAAKVAVGRMDRADVAAKAAEHVPDAIKQIVHLMKHAKRDAVKLRAALSIVELASDVEHDHETTTKVYVLATGDTSHMAAKLRARLRANTEG